MKVTGKTESSAVLPSTSQKRLFGLRGKMFVLFFFIPICLILVASLMYMRQLSTLSSHLAERSSPR